MTPRKKEILVRIINKQHPHYGERGYLKQEDVPLSLSFLDTADLIVRYDEGLGQEIEFFAKKSDYEEG